MNNDIESGNTNPRCERCINRHSCWQYDVRSKSGRICDAYQPW